MSELLFGPDPEWPDDGEPAYRALASYYREKITSGVLADGTKLPSQRQMVEQHQLSPITIKAAIRQLADEGLIRSHRGKGQFVRRATKVERIRPTGYMNPDGRMTYAREAQAAGRQVEAEHETTTTHATAHVADLLDMDEGDPVSATSYHIRMDSQPHSMSVAYEPLSITGGTEIENPHAGPVGGSGLLNRFRHIGLEIIEIEERLDVRPPTPGEADALTIPSQVQVVEVTQVARAVTTSETFYSGLTPVPVEASVIVFPSDRVKFVYRLPIGRPNTP